MAFIRGLINYFVDSRAQIFSLLLEHIQLTAIAVGVAILIGVPLGILICYIRKASKPVLGVANVIQAVPSMALLGFAIPILGIGTVPAVVVVVLYSLLPIIKNTFAGIHGISPEMVEAAQGIGMSRFQILYKVQIPQALPVIMAGVRISAVTAVGLMTMAAFIGGGGLGYLVFSGIRTVDNYQIIAGALPACLLALLVDFLFGVIEKLVTPISLQLTGQKNPKKARRTQKVILSVTAAVLVLLFAWNGISSILANRRTGDTITVAGKDYTEQVVLCHMVSDLIEANTDLTVKRSPMLGGSQVCMGAIQSGEIDLYIDYTGTCYGDTLGYTPISDVEKVYQTVVRDFDEKYDLKILKQMAFNNTYTLAVKPETAQEYNLKTFSDLARVSDQMVISPTLEFTNRDDGLPGVMKKYDMDFKKVVAMDSSPRYIALMNGESDVVDAFATDGLLKKFDLTVLEDDQQFFPPYYAVPVIRSDVLEQYPELEDLLSQLGDTLTNEVMSDLNYQVDEEGKDPEAVAHDYLATHDLLLYFRRHQSHRAMVRQAAPATVSHPRGR